MTKNKTFLLKQQYGGMLVEIMMTLAISAIMIPFIFRYQQNAVERARNIAVSKQMEMVQGALEKYIVKNRSTYINHSGNHTWDNVHICHLIDEKFLSDDFSNDCSGSDCISGCRARKNDSTDFGKYFLRILKTNVQNKDILQGVVLLTNEETTPLRTRGIVNMGGGKIGYIDGNDVRGGFNVFLRPKTNMGLSNQSDGVVSVTGTLRGSNEYLWRVPSANDMDATMLSPLNLDGHDVVNINDASVYNAFFDTELNANKINVQNTIYFLQRPTFSLNTNFSFISTEGNITGHLASGDSGSSLTVREILYINGTHGGQFNKLVSDGTMDINTISNLETFVVKPSSGVISFARKEGTSLSLGAKKAFFDSGRVIFVTNPDNQIAGGTPVLDVQSIIRNKNTDYYWDAKNKKIRLKNLALTNLPKILDLAYKKTHSGDDGGLTYFEERFPQGYVGGNGDDKFKLFSDEYLKGITKTTPILEVLDVRLCKIKAIINVKYKCVASSNWDDDSCKAVKNKNYDAYTKHCTVGAI